MGVSAPVPAAARGSRLELPRVLTAREAREFGLSRGTVAHAIDRLGWQRLARGLVLTAPGAPTRADWAQVGIAMGGPGAALSGWDAARIIGLGAPAPSSPRVLVLARTGDHRVIGGVRIRPTRRPYGTRLGSADHPELAFVPVVSVPRAIADTALDCRSFTAVRGLVTAAIQRRRCTPQQLAAELERCPRNGSAHLRRALADVFANAHSVAEAEAIDVLRRSGARPFEANVPIFDGAGQHIATVDLLWRELRAVLEIDSREFHFGEAEWQHTMRRHNQLTALGYAVSHYPPSAVRRRGQAWGAEVNRWLDARAGELGLG